jgi:HPt (histidine-containing phosphotransfer) domain-containing protein
MFKIDLTYLETISGGDQQFINEMLTMVMNTTLTEIVTLNQHALRGEWDQVGSIAHKIKAPLQMLGVQIVSDLVIDIEQSGKHATQVDAIHDKVKLLESYMVELSKQVKELLDK